MIQARKYKKILFVPKDGGVAYLRKSNGVVVMIGRDGRTHISEITLHNLMSSNLYILVRKPSHLFMALKKFIDE